MTANPYQAYQNNSVTTASPGELTLMLYNGCLRFIKQGKQAMADGDLEKKNTNLQKAQKIIHELMATMDTQYEVTESILPLYEFISHRLMEGNTQNNEEFLDEAADLVAEFRDTWKEVIQINRKTRHGQGGQA